MFTIDFSANRGEFEPYVFRLMQGETVPYKLKYTGTDSASTNGQAHFFYQDGSTATMNIVFDPTQMEVEITPPSAKAGQHQVAFKIDENLSPKYYFTVAEYKMEVQ